jgi:predicted  nucleic acid-binding Zn-ribbon protein
MKSIAQRLAEVNAQIADIDNQIVQQQKRAENLRAKGADSTEAQAVLATMMETRAYLEAHKAELLRHQSAGD